MRTLVEEQEPRQTSGPARGPIIANAGGKRRSALGITAFVLELYPEAKDHGPSAERIRVEPARWIRAGGGSMQETWVLGFAGLCHTDPGRLFTSKWGEN